MGDGDGRRVDGTPVKLKRVETMGNTKLGTFRVTPVAIMEVADGWCPCYRRQS
jgi:hypothetical protein